MSILYPLSFFELFIINRKSVRFTAGIPDTSRIGTVGGEVANLGNDALRTDIDVLGVASALVGYQIRTDIERELRRAGASARALGVHVELFTLTAGLHRAFTVGIVSVGMVVVYLGHGIRILFRGSSHPSLRPAGTFCPQSCRRYRPGHSPHEVFRRTARPVA